MALTRIERMDEQGIKLRELAEPLAWKDLTEVSLVTTATGPNQDDVFFLLKSADRRAMIAQSDPQSPDLLAWVQKLEGFDNLAFLEAMSCTEPREHLCWKRPA